MLPFLVDMARLYELFVSEWLKENLPKGFFIKAQHQVNIGQNRHFRIDLLLCDVETGESLAVLDTKYKVPDKAAIADIHEMVSHSLATKCNQTILIYPNPLDEPLDVKINHIRIRSLTFSIDGNLHLSGQYFLKSFLALS
jgi:5-methylcytosine-specific restriction enzyme subunit McrC